MRRIRPKTEYLKRNRSQKRVGFVVPEHDGTMKSEVAYPQIRFSNIALHAPPVRQRKHKPRYRRNAKPAQKRSWERRISRPRIHERLHALGTRPPAFRDVYIHPERRHS